MMRRGLLFVAVMTLMSLGLRSACEAQQSLVGKYELVFSNDATWHRNAVDIKTATASVVRGTVLIDWGIGPQGRAPKPDEKVHMVPFEARLDKSGAMRFSVTVGVTTPTSYDFELHPIEREGSFLVGVATVTPKAADGVQRTGPWRVGVLGRRRR